MLDAQAPYPKTVRIGVRTDFLVRRDNTKTTLSLLRCTFVSLNIGFVSPPLSGWCYLATSRLHLLDADYSMPGL